MCRGKFVDSELQMFVCIRFIGIRYRLVWMIFHLSSTWVQKGLLNLRLRASVLCVRKAMGVGVLWLRRIFAQSSVEV